jgi:enoyl-CoA hydratase/carnithine racemase/3-hydroxyacyl-CoA dehydrogenase
LKASFVAKTANEIMSNIIRFNYDGSSLPKKLDGFKPRFLLEAIPEILELKKAHYEMMRKRFPGIEIRSVTSGFPRSELGVGILNPSFPHQINKVWEVIEEKPSPITHLLLAMGLIPMPVSDNWSFVLDVLFCGITLCATRYHLASNMPYWKIDKLIRRLVGPNPMRAHDVIGPGASFLTWSCLHHLAEKYGAVFRPSTELVRRKTTGEAWYLSNRPVVDWSLSDEEEFKSWILGPLFQMTSLMLKEKRAHLSLMNTIGENCAQFNKGILALIRNIGAESVIKIVESYHKKQPEAGKSCWYPEVLADIESSEWQQLYVNAEHNGEVGLITISRESLNWEVINELNRALDWLKREGIDKIILTGDFHLSTQLVGADTTEFYPALSEESKGYEVAFHWSKTARRLGDDFKVSVGFINGKRCLGGMLELMMHCQYLVSVEGAQIGMPEVTLPVVPGMEGCHLPFRKTGCANYNKILTMLMTGKSLSAKDGQGWLIDYSAPLNEALKKIWEIVTFKDHGLPLRKVEKGEIPISAESISIPVCDNKLVIAGRKAIFECIKSACAVNYNQALTVQARHSAGFMISQECKKGVIGKNYSKSMGL